MLKKIPDGEMKVLAGRFAGRPLAGVEGAEARPPARRSRESIFEFVGQRVCAGGG
jgi:16S rRNA G966 N2-methylase RsmD